MPKTFPAPLVALPALLVVAALAYLPGLSGGFLFDDLANLPAIGAGGPVDDAATFWRYLTSGTADPIGRPLSLLTFLADARDWPADPAPFLRTNLLLHLFNGVLLFWLLRALGTRLGDTSRPRDAAALLGAGMWLLHPLFVSTTLYIVQRHAILPTTFTLLGLLVWTHGRLAFARSPRKGAAWMVAGLGGGTLLAMLSKANGILLPLLAWTLATSVLRPTDATLASPRMRAMGRWDAVLLGLPAIAVFAYLSRFLPRLAEDLPTRAWTIGERLLTEPRVLVDYLQLLAVPRVLSTGLYNDGYALSTGLAQPWSTLPAIIAVIGLLAMGLALRRRAPDWAAGILFFLVGHLLESTVVPLELYFEHRNYLPAMLLFWPLARALCRWRVAPALRTGIGIGLLALLAAITWQRATLWSQPERMAKLWALQNPSSSRAQAAAANLEAQRDPVAARDALRPRWLAQPDDLQLALNYASAACRAGGLSAADVAGISDSLRRAREGDQLLHRWLSRALDIAGSERCKGLDYAAVDDWIQASLANPWLASLAGRRQDLHSVAGQLALRHGDADAGLKHFNRALAAYVTPDAAAQQVAQLAVAGHYRHALAHLDYYERLKSRRIRADRGWDMQRVHEWVLDRQGYWDHELGRLRRNLAGEIAAGNADGPEAPAHGN